MSSTASTLVLSFVNSQLKSLTDEASCKEFGHLVDVTCNWGRGEDLLDFITDHLQEMLISFISDQSESEASHSRTRKGFNSFKSAILKQDLISSQILQVLERSGFLSKKLTRLSPCWDYVV